MDFKVIFTETFLADLERMIRFIAAENATAARTLADRIVDAGESLSAFPERHPRVRQRPLLRRLIVGRHFKVFYRIDHDSRVVEVLRCWDARREGNPPFAV
jgi:plasmid stabilization system protein ParE